MPKTDAKTYVAALLLVAMLGLTAHAQEVVPSDEAGAMAPSPDLGQQVRGDYWKWAVLLGTVGVLEALPGEPLSQEAWHSAVAMRIALVAFVVAAVGHIFFGWWR